ncbi:MAG: hypothetical protein LBT40_05700 [Deltaproteobacteria bacterium]|jgi:hypothetical protein|nr:hypothetical protein [Deltaproteobacteria bacterium]
MTGKSNDGKKIQQIDHPRTAKLVDYFFVSLVKKALDMSRIAWDGEECDPEDIYADLHVLSQLLDGLSDYRDGYELAYCQQSYMEECRAISCEVFADELDEFVIRIWRFAKNWHTGRRVLGRLRKARSMGVTDKEIKAFADERLSEKFRGAPAEKFLVYIKK